MQRLVASPISGVQINLGQFIAVAVKKSTPFGNGRQNGSKITDNHSFSPALLANTFAFAR